MKLKYTAGKKFKIAQFTDTHIGNLPYNEDDFRTFNLVENALEKLDLDLIIHTGDIVWSDGVKDADKIFEEFLGYFDKYKIPMAITFGNHDTEEIVTRARCREIFDKVVEKKADKRNSFIVDDKESYTLEIFGSSDDEIKNIIYMVDSGAFDKMGFGEYDWNDPLQVSWFRDVSKKYKKGDGVKRNILFQHIPLPEYWQGAENIIDGLCLETNEMISAPKINTGLFANMAINGEMWGMSCGHDHENNFLSEVHGIKLAFGQISGYQCYGQLERGVRIFELSEDGSVETYTLAEKDF